MLFDHDYLYHFSEEDTIRQFIPRSVGNQQDAVVWAIDSLHAPNYLLPRDCPRICIALNPETTLADHEQFFGLTSARRIIMVESRWLKPIQTTRLFAYKFKRDSFVEHDANAGYWVTYQAVAPISIQPVGDLLQALIDQGVELRVMPSLTLMQAAVAESSLQFSMIRMRNMADPALV